MNVQLPEPEHYTLKKVTKRWDTEANFLLQLAHENKLTLAVKVPHLFPLSVAGQNDDGTIFIVPYAALREAGVNDEVQLFQNQNYILYAPPVLTLIGGVPQWMNTPDGRYRVVYQPNSLFTPYRMSTVPPKSLPNDWFYIPYTSAENNYQPLIKQASMMRMDSLVILPDEVHRIEHRHEAAEEAAAADVLGTKERDTLESIVYALTILVSKGSLGLMNGVKPNASAIAKLIETSKLSDRAKETIRKKIGNIYNKFCC